LGKGVPCRIWNCTRRIRAERVHGRQQVWFCTFKEQRLDVFVDHPTGTRSRCPQCSLPLACNDHTPERRWRHLDRCPFKTLPHASAPRVDCSEHGVKQVSVAWAGKGSRFTIRLRRPVIQLLLATQTITAEMSIQRSERNQTLSIVKRAVGKEKALRDSQAVPRLAIDKKAIPMGQNYIAHLYDLVNGTVEGISRGHDRDRGVACLPRLSEAEIQSGEKTAMHMSASNVQAAKQVIPLAENKIVNNRFTCCRWLLRL